MGYIGLKEQKIFSENDYFISRLFYHIDFINLIDTHDILKVIFYE